MFFCRACKKSLHGWFAQCPLCNAWSTIETAVPIGVVVDHDDDGSPLVAVTPPRDRQRIPIVADAPPNDDDAGAGDDCELPIPITAVSREHVPRFITNIPALDHVLGGGLVPGGSVLVGADPGAGKCLGRGTLITMADGRAIAVENIAVGDRLMGPDGNPRIVLSLSSGEDELYRVDPIKGEPWVCNSRHIMTLVNSGTGEVFDMPLSHLLEAHQQFRHHAKLFSVGIDCFEHDDPEMRPVDPYFLGLWFGDGTKQLDRHGRLLKVQITKPDIEVKHACLRIAEMYGVRLCVFDR